MRCLKKRMDTTQVAPEYRILRCECGLPRARGIVVQYSYPSMVCQRMYCMCWQAPKVWSVHMQNRYILSWSSAVVLAQSILHANQACSNRLWHPIVWSILQSDATNMDISSFFRLQTAAKDQVRGHKCFFSPHFLFFSPPLRRAPQLLRKHVTSLIPVKNHIYI